jgi:Ca2+-binding RTX toxin-like protein
MTTTPTLWRPLTQANTNDNPPDLSDADGQFGSTVIGLSGNRYFIAWEDDTSFYTGFEPSDIAGRIFDAQGNQLVAEQGYNFIYWDLSQQAVSVAELTDGSIIVAYQTTDAAMFGDLENITVERYSATGTFLDRDDFRGPANDTAPSVVALQGGAYALVYEDDVSGTRSISAHVVSGAGVVGPIIDIASGLGVKSNPQTAAFANGNFIVVYQNDPGVNSDVVFSIRSSAGAPVTSGNVAVTGANENSARVATRADNSFAIVWQEGDGVAAGDIKFSIFNSAGTPSVGPLTVSAAAGIQKSPAIVTLLDGSLMIAWVAVDNTIAGQRFDGVTGATIGTIVTLLDSDTLSNPNLALMSDGRFTVSADNLSVTNNPDVVSAIWDPREAAITGGTGNDSLTSRTDGATVSGLGGDDTLISGAAADTLIGGTGNDVFVNPTGDTITELAAQGTDRVESNTTFSLASIANVENLTLTGTGNFNAIGNTLANVLTGNAGNNRMRGGDGADTLIGGQGNDTYIDPTGDTIQEQAVSGTDTVESSMTFSLAAIANVENLILTGAGNIDGTGNGLDNVITGNGGNNRLNGGVGFDTLIGGAGNDTYVDPLNVTIQEAAGPGGGIDTVESAFSVNLQAAANVENVVITGALGASVTGNDLANTITGNSASNYIVGGLGADTLIGGDGDDTYVNPTGDIIVETSTGGGDGVESDVSFSLVGLNFIERIGLTGLANIDATGNDFGNSLSGNDGNNLITGAAGNDGLNGFGGNDTLLGGTGSDYMDAGGGNDRLEGGSEFDYLIGGAGNDTFINVGTDSVDEAVGGGYDEIITNTHQGMAANVEKLTLTGLANLNATGNASANLMIGNAGNNRLRGADGVDTLVGGLGNDTYIDPTGDIISESAGQGTDTVESAATFVLSGIAHVENLTLTGSAAINGTGNSYDNLITGNSGANRLRGGAGEDTLIGGSGVDTFVFGAVSDSTGVNRDVIQSMNLMNEKFDFANIPVSLGVTVTVGTLNEASFDTDLQAAIGAGQMGALQAVLFDPSAGTANIAGSLYLVVDVNGVAGYQAGQDYVVQLAGSTGTLTLDDFT